MCGFCGVEAPTGGLWFVGGVLGAGIAASIAARSPRRSALPAALELAAAPGAYGYFRSVLLAEGGAQRCPPPALSDRTSIRATNSF